MSVANRQGVPATKFWRLDFGLKEAGMETARGMWPIDVEGEERRIRDRKRADLYPALLEALEGIVEAYGWVNTDRREPQCAYCFAQWHRDTGCTHAVGCVVLKAQAAIEAAREG